MTGTRERRSENTMDTEDPSQTTNENYLDPNNNEINEEIDENNNNNNNNNTTDNVKIEKYTITNNEQTVRKWLSDTIKVKLFTEKNNNENNNCTESIQLPNETLCKVCGDISSGRHYGQYTCDGCSGFFMRSVRKNMTYRCKGTNSCIVDKKRRNQCQACRFEKCLRVNMNRYAVQQERQPNNQFGFHHRHHHHHLSFHGLPPYLYPRSMSYYPPPPQPPPSLAAHLITNSVGHEPPVLNDIEDNKRKRQQKYHLREYKAPLSSSPSLYSRLHQQPYPLRRLSPPLRSRSPPHYSFHPSPPSPPPPDSTATTHGQSRSHSRQQQQNHQQQQKSRSSPTSFTHHQQQDTRSSSLISTTAATFTNKPIKVKTEDEQSAIPEKLQDIAARLLYHTIKWARSVPAFNELSTSDQIKLLENSWSDIFILFAFQWHLRIKSNEIMASIKERSKGDNGDDSRCKTNTASVKTELQTLENLSDKFQSFCVSEDEFIFLKSVVLFKPEVHGLMDPVHIERCQDRAQIMLRNHVTSCSTRDHPVRFGKLLLLLPEVKKITAKTIEEILFQQNLGTFSFETLLADLFKQ